MTKPAYYLHYNVATGDSTGQGYSSDGTIPTDCVACTASQAQNWQQYAIDLTTTPPSIVDAPAAVLLAQAQAAQIASLTAAYESAISAPVSFKTAAGTTALFATTPTAVGYLQGVLAAGSAVWTANLWLSNAGSVITPFTFADVQGLAAAIEAMETPDYQELLKLIGEVQAATTIAGVQAVVWP